MPGTVAGASRLLNAALILCGGRGLGTLTLSSPYSCEASTQLSGAGQSGCLEPEVLGPREKAPFGCGLGETALILESRVAALSSATQYMTSTGHWPPLSLSVPISKVRLMIVKGLTGLPWL